MIENNFILKTVDDTYSLDDSYTKGLLLLSLTVMGNFVAETLGCSTQKLLNTNRIAKLSVIFFLIYFTLNIASGIDGKKVHPLTELKMTFLLWIAFIIFTKMGKVNTIIVFTCLCLHYLVSNFYKYYKDNNINDYNNIIEVLDKSLVIIILISTIIGFVSYVIKEKREHKRFSWYKFFIGVDHCKNI